MPFTPDTPETGTITAETEVTLDEIQIVQILIKLDPNAPASATINCEWQEGTTVNGVYRASQSHSTILSGNDLIAKMTSATQNGESIYDAVKRGLYELLQARELIPPGTIS